MRPQFTVTLIAALIMGAAIPALAHHSFAAEYDSTKPIDFKGTVTKVEWANPHIYFYVDVTDSSGKVTNYAVEGGAPNVLYRQGWRKDSLKVGDVVNVHGYKAKDGSNLANLQTVTLADGRRLFSGTPEGSPAERDRR